MQQALNEKDKAVEKLMGKVQAADKAQLARVEKEVKFSIGQLGGKRKRDLRRVGGGVYATTDKDGTEMMVLVQIVPDPVTKVDSAIVVFEDEKGNNRSVELVEFLTSK